MGAPKVTENTSRMFARQVILSFRSGCFFLRIFGVTFDPSHATHFGLCPMAASTQLFLTAIVSTID